MTELFGPFQHFPQGSDLDAVEPAASGSPRSHQAGAAQDAQVLGNGRLGHAEGRGHLQDGAFVVGKQDEDGAARGVGECVEDGMGMKGTRHGGRD